MTTATVTPIRDFDPARLLAEAQYFAERAEHEPDPRIALGFAREAARLERVHNWLTINPTGVDQ